MHSKNLRQLSFDPNLKHEELEKDRLPAKNHFSRSIHFLVFCLENFFLSLIIFQNSESHQPTLVISFCIGFREFLLCECYELLAVRCDKDPDSSCLPAATTSTCYANRCVCSSFRARAGHVPTFSGRFVNG